MESQVVLPDDLVNEIFQHLPVKSLARFKCVSKHYKFLISSRRFINTVLKRYPEPNNMLLCHCVDPIERIVFGSFDHVKHYDVPRSLDLSNHELSRVAGTYHGLICFSDYENSSASVWNPVTNQLRKFPFQRLSKGLFTSVGFGYDAINDDYKAVRISTQCDQAYNLTIEIFELRNFESRIINLSTIDQVPFLLSSAMPVTVDGSSHWIAFHTQNKTLHIVRFDMDHEKFAEIPFSNDMPNINYDVDVRRRDVNPLTPEALASAQRLVVNDKEFILGVLNGFLCLFIKKRSEMEACSEMEAWLMNCKNHDGSNVEWTKLFEILLIQTTEKALVINVTSNNEVVIHNRRFNNLEHWKRMSLTLTRCRHNPIHQPVAYVESLVDPWLQ